jgi:hypothetical protein
MAEYTDREHYIPLRKSDLVALLAKDKKLPAEEREAFRAFCRLVSNTFHFEYLQQLEQLKDDYAPFDPDKETTDLRKLSPEEKRSDCEELFDVFVALMERANFKRLTRDDVRKAIEGGASDWGVNMYVDFDVFEKLEIFARGDTIGKRSKRHPWKLWKFEEKEVPIYRRLVFMTKLKPHKHLGPNVNTEAVYIKAFKDIPKLDLEMLLPGATLQMPRFQQWKMRGTLLGGLGMVCYNMLDDLLRLMGNIIHGALAQIGTALLWGPAAALLGYGYKQYWSWSYARQGYSLMLTESLYYQNLDNNAGVLTRILDEAEEQECRETILGYHFLLKHAPSEGWTAEQLDDYIEMYLEGETRLKVDFEIGDALAKLERLKLVEQQNGRYTAVPLTKALEQLDYLWDNYFPYNKQEREPSA